MEFLKKWYGQFKKLSTIEKIAVVLVLWWLWSFVKKYLDRFANNAGAKADQLADIQLSNTTGIPVERIEILRGLAVDLQSALWDWKERWPFGWQQQWYEDEDAVISIINSCKSVSEVRQLSRFFVEAYPEKLPQEKKKTLKASVQELLSAGEQDEIKSTYRGALI